ncbi:MAG: hypothetical protein H7Y15_14530 [Pseudonocardia sp.]|nr:hypothetical protein [Pseudonocardia sp.]
MGRPGLIGGRRSAYLLAHRDENNSAVNVPELRMAPLGRRVTEAGAF